MPVNSKRSAMKKSRRKNSSPKPRRSRSKGQDYTMLEDRKMLTVSSGFAPATGILSINLASANEAAVVDVVGSNVTVNGAQIGTGVAATNVNQIVITGTGAANQDVTFNGDFSNSGLTSVSAVNVDDVAINGNLSLSGNLTVNASGNVSDSDGTDIIVGGIADFTAANVTLGGANNETRFQQSGFNVSSAVDLQEDDNIVLGDLNAGTVRLASNGRILDGFTTQINITGAAELLGNAGVRLGDNGADVFNAGTVSFVSNGQVSINEDSAINLVGDNSARSINLRSQAAITDADDSTLNVEFQSGFTATSVLIGDTDTDEFNSNSIYFFTTGRFDLTEDSDIIIIEEKNEALSLSLTSTGEIGDDTNTQVTVANLAEFNAASVVIGNSPTDFFTAGSIQYNTTGQFVLTENNDTNILGVNRATNSIITSVGNLSNSANADIVVTNNASFRAQNVNIGNQPGDNAQFGSLTFITPNVAIDNAPQGFASVNITEDDATTFGGNSTAGTADIPGNVRIESADSITDGTNSSVNVTGNLTLVTNNNGAIVVGEAGTDVNGNAFNSTFNTASLTIQTDGTGNAQIFEDSNIFLVGDNQVNSLTLNADGGNGSITDSATAQINVNFNLNVTGGFVNLGSAVDGNGANTDSLNFSSLTFNTSPTGNLNGNTLISADSGFFLVGSSSAENLTLASTGNILDSSPAGGVAATTIIQNSANFTTPLDAIIGESGNDFFDILSGNPAGVGNVGGTANVVVGRVIA